MPRKPSASRARSRRLGLLGLLLTTLLTPAGIMVGTVTAAVLIGGAFHLYRAAHEAPTTPQRPLSVKTGSPQHVSIERDGKPVILVMAEDEIGTGGGVGSFDPASPLFAGLVDGSRAQHISPNGTSPGASMPGRRPPSRGPSNPPDADGHHPPTGNGDTDEPPGEAGSPTKPDEDKQTETLEPILILPEPKYTPPQEPVPGIEPDTPPGLPPPAGNPIGPQAPSPGKQSAMQPNAIPEPSMLGLMLLGSAAMAWAGRRRSARAA